MTKEQQRISDRNHKKAVKYFESTGELPKDREPYEYVIHHSDKSLRHTNIERYIQWAIEDLEVMTRSEHTKFHYEDINTEESRYKMGWKRATGKPKPAPVSREIWNKNISKAKKQMYIDHPEKRPIGDKNPNYGHGERQSGERNGMYGKPSANRGRHWKTVDGKRVYYD